MGNLTLEQLARNFAEEIGRNYQENLDFWIVTARDDGEEKEYWEGRIKKEVPIVTENVYKKVLEIMNNPKQNNKYLLRKWLFKNKNVLVINHKTGFFDDLLPGRNIKFCFSINVEYHIDMKNLSFIKVVFPHRRK